VTVPPLIIASVAPKYIEYDLRRTNAWPLLLTDMQIALR